MTELQRAPRSVPFFLGIQCLFGGLAQQVGWGVTVFGMLFALVFGSMINLPKEIGLRGDLATVQGVVRNQRETNATVNETEVVEYLVEYQVEGSTFLDTCYTTGYEWDPGDTVSVEYPVDRPSWGRAVGSRASTFPAWTLLLVGIFPTIGLLLAVSGFRKGLKSRSLLACGKLAQGVLISKEPTNQTINESTVYELTFRFTPEGARREFTTVARTHRTELLEDEEQETMLYDSRFPSDAVLMDNLPAKAHIGADGRLQGGSLIGAVGVLILPLLSAILIALTFLVMMPEI